MTLLLLFAILLYMLMIGGGGEGGGPTDNQNINKRGGGCLKNVLGLKWQPVVTNNACPKQNFLYIN